MSLEKEYARTITAMSRTGILTLLPKSKKTGVIGIDGEEYPVPTQEQLQEVFVFSFFNSGKQNGLFLETDGKRTSVIRHDFRFRRLLIPHPAIMPNPSASLREQGRNSIGH